MSTIIHVEKVHPRERWLGQGHTTNQEQDLVYIGHKPMVWNRPIRPPLQFTHLLLISYWYSKIQSSYRRMSGPGRGWERPLATGPCSPDTQASPASTHHVRMQTFNMQLESPAQLTADRAPLPRLLIRSPRSGGRVGFTAFPARLAPRPPADLRPSPNWTPQAVLRRGVQRPRRCPAGQAILPPLTVPPDWPGRARLAVHSPPLGSRGWGKAPSAIPGASPLPHTAPIAAARCCTWRARANGSLRWPVTRLVALGAFKVGWGGCGVLSACSADAVGWFRGQFCRTEGSRSPVLTPPAFPGLHQ